MDNPSLVSKPEMLKIVGLSYVSVWGKMTKGLFPRGVMIANKTFWVRSEVEQWHKEFLASAPRQVLKGDVPVKKAKAGNAR